MFDRSFLSVCSGPEENLLISCHFSIITQAEIMICLFCTLNFDINPRGELETADPTLHSDHELDNIITLPITS